MLQVVHFCEYGYSTPSILQYSAPMVDLATIQKTLEEFVENPTKKGVSNTLTTNDNISVYGLKSQDYYIITIGSRNLEFLGISDILGILEQLKVVLDN
jgi:hypothetical protein